MFLTRLQLSIIHVSLALLSLFHLATPSLIHLPSPFSARLSNPYPLPCGDRFLDFYIAGNPVPPASRTLKFPSRSLPAAIDDLIQKVIVEGVARRIGWRYYKKADSRRKGSEVLPPDRCEVAVYGSQMAEQGLSWNDTVSSSGLSIFGRILSPIGILCRLLWCTRLVQVSLFRCF